MNATTARQVLRVVPSWLAGLAISTPIVAILQGVLLLQDYRSNHGHAPRPDMPVRGVVVVGPDSDDPGAYMATSSSTSQTQTVDSTTNSSNLNRLEQLKKLYYTSNKPPEQQPPLRLLVIGDSLAAGVGMSQSGTPALPEAIARGLSQATGGRAVYWTCVGTPGVTSSEIVQEIRHLDDVINIYPNKKNNKNKNDGNDGGQVTSPASLLIHKLTDWQAESRVRANEQLRVARRRAKKFLKHRKEPVSVDDDDDDDDKNDDEAVKAESKRKRVVQWCKRKAAEIQRDLQGIKQFILDGDGDEDDEDDNDTEDAKTEAAARPSGSLVRRKTLDPKVIGEFDIAIVLTGLNDLKEVFLPFMMSAQRQQMLEELDEGRETNGHGGMKAELIRVVHALKSKMNLFIPGEDNTPTETVPEGTKAPMQNIEKNGPVIVFPALPFSPSILSQRAPLSWFMSPLIRQMDHNKKILSEMYPEIVVFVDSPDPYFFSQTEAKKGAVWEDFQRERVLLRLTDIALNVRERVEATMKQHYNAWVLDAEDGEGHYDIIADSVTHSHDNKKQRHPGASMVAIDGVHPNDSGYEVWGRYIALDIAKKWKP